MTAFRPSGFGTFETLDFGGCIEAEWKIFARWGNLGVLIRRRSGGLGQTLFCSCAGREAGALMRAVCMWRD